VDVNPPLTEQPPGLQPQRSASQTDHLFPASLS
jgi:hypothetical protein